MPNQLLLYELLKGKMKDGKQKSFMINNRLDNLIKMRCKNEGMRYSEFIREALVEKYLNNPQEELVG